MSDTYSASDRGSKAYNGPDAWILLDGQPVALEHKTCAPGDRSSDPGSRYGMCLREEEKNYDCHSCGDSGVLGPFKDMTREYCDCTLGRYLERVEGEEPTS